MRKELENASLLTNLENASLIEKNPTSGDYFTPVVLHHPLSSELRVTQAFSILVHSVEKLFAKRLPRIFLKDTVNSFVIAK